MALLIFGLILFLGLHSVRIVADGGRAAFVERFGEMSYKGVYSVLSLIGIVLVSMGYKRAYGEYGFLYEPVAGLSHLALILVPIAFVLVAAAYAPAGHIKQAVKHPMVLGVALWALGHLLANGMVADVVLFGAFLAWALADYASALSRPLPVKGAVSAKGDIAALAIGLIMAGLFIAFLHRYLFGVSPVG
ncbi:MAG: NnrU family protein [Pseudomonadota bacterium]|nr:NnrU family protein [Pseudomonadota bacterium]